MYGFGSSFLRVGSTHVEKADPGQWNDFFSHKFGEVTDHLDRRIDQILRK